MGKKELQVAAIENGTVIDHIPSEKTYEVARLLHLTDIDVPTLIGYNLPSKRLGKKGIIKITNKYFTDEEISRLSVIAPNVVWSSHPMRSTASSSATTPSASPTTSPWTPSLPSSTKKKVS